MSKYFDGLLASSAYMSSVRQGGVVLLNAGRHAPEIAAHIVQRAPLAPCQCEPVEVPVELTVPLASVVILHAGLSGCSVGSLIWVSQGNGADIYKFDGPPQLSYFGMPLVTNLIDDKSPLIQYDSTWLPGNTVDDISADQYAVFTSYYLGTFSTNNVTNGQASFSFNGTGVWVYGARRLNHAPYYYVQLDDVTWGPYNGVSTTQAFMQPIFNDSGLTQKMHTLTLMNHGSGGNNYVDIDLIVWQSEVGKSDQQVIRETIQDTDSRFQYHNSAWSSSPSDAKFYNNGTGHYTEVDGATVTLTFTVGSTTSYLFGHGITRSIPRMVTLFGAIGTSNGLYSVQLDGGNATQYNGTAFLPFYGVTLFHADNLGSGQHQVTLTNTASVTGQRLSIDYAIVSTLFSDTSSNSISYQLSTGDIVGITFCGAIASLMINFTTLALLESHPGRWWLFRHR
ncbi:hypothetical protein EDD15DRAFT_2520205 [Pisolithus albus]|nr:hypothetical protein EDD15DRAFT_2520205 [Pisolithus albus]